MLFYCALLFVVWLCMHVQNFPNSQDDLKKKKKSLRSVTFQVFLGVVLC